MKNMAKKNKNKKTNGMAHINSTAMHDGNVEYKYLSQYKTLKTKRIVKREKEDVMDSTYANLITKYADTISEPMPFRKLIEKEGKKGFDTYAFMRLIAECHNTDNIKIEEKYIEKDEEKNNHRIVYGYAVFNINGVKIMIQSYEGAKTIAPVE